MCQHQKKLKIYALNTALGRFRFATEGARGYDVYRSCTSKFRYKDEYSANKVAKRMAFDNGVVLRVYHCKFCSGFHLTSKPLHAEAASHFVAVA